MIASLPPKSRIVVVLRYQEDLEPEEIARVLGWRLNTVKSRLQRSLKVLYQRNGENVDVLFKTENGSFAGIAVIVAKPEEFTFVRIEGAVDLAQLAKLGGQFGVPKMDLPGQSGKAPE